LSGRRSRRREDAVVEVKLDPWVEGYIAYLGEVRRLTPATVRDVRCTLKRVSAAMSLLRPDTPLWKARLEDYLKWMEKERGERRSAASMAKDLSYIRGLLDYAWRSGRSDRNVLDGFQLMDGGPKKAPPVLTIEEALRLVESCPRGNRGERRDRAMILVLYGCGLRTAELCGLDVGDLDAQIYLHMTARDLREAADRHPIAALVDTVKDLLPDVRYRFQTPPVARTG